MVFYRKYRPQTIHDLDLDSVREKLTSILSSPNIPHAFLFTGPKGLGKTSSARILAKAINCLAKQDPASQVEKRATSNQPLATSSKKKKEERTINIDSRLRGNDNGIEPCNICDACVSITNGSALDVLEIDAASNRGIDEIRDLRDKIKFAPSSLRKKVYIIDEVHMLTTEAFNALLKTLEEPPDHAIFILCTTEYWKLPQTIVSRAFGVQFEKPSQQEVLRSLSRVVDGEKLEVEDGVLYKIFELSDGAFRDGAKILEELALSSKNKRITIELLEKVYKSGSIDQEVRELLVQLSQKNAKGALETIGKLSANGCDFKVVIEKIVEELRKGLLSSQGLMENGKQIHPENSFRGKMENLKVQDIEKLLELFNEAYKNVKFSPIPQLPLELAVVKWCILEGNSSLRDHEVAFTLEGKQPSLGNNPIKIASSFTSSANVKLNPRNDGSNRDFLKNLIFSIQKENFSIAGVLRSCSLISITDSEVKIEAPFKFHGEKLRDAKVTAMLESDAKGLLGHDVKFIISVKGE